MYQISDDSFGMFLDALKRFWIRCWQMGLQLTRQEKGKALLPGPMWFLNLKKDKTFELRVPFANLTIFARPLSLRS